MMEELRNKNKGILFRNLGLNKKLGHIIQKFGVEGKKNPKVLKEFATGELSLGLARCMAYREYDDCFSICFIVLFNFLIYMHILL